jgi:hypothetical protein
MKRIFTLIVAFAFIGPLANAQHKAVFGQQKSERQKLEVDKSFRIAKTIAPVTINPLLKQTAVAEQLVAMTYYNWTGLDWDFSNSTDFDDQNRPVEMNYGNNRSLIEYIGTTGKTTIYQNRENELSPWENVSKEVVIEDENNQLSEQWFYSPEDGWVMVGGNKHEQSIETVGLITTEINANYHYDFMANGYIQDDGYKSILELNADGTYLREDEYYWDSGLENWVKDWEQWYEYDMDGTLLFMHSIEDGVTQSIEMVYGPNEADGPIMGYVYHSEGGSPLALAGRYTDIIWGAEWSILLQGNDLEPASGTVQMVIDPDGDKFDDNNYVNSEKFASSENFYEWYVWVDDAWLLIETYKIEVDGMGVETTTDMMLEFDKDLSMVVYGYQEIEVVDGDDYTITDYDFDVDLQELVPSTMETYVVLDELGSYEMTNSTWADFNADEIFEWETEAYAKNQFEPGLLTSTNQDYELGELVHSDNYEYEYDSNGMIIYYRNSGLSYGALEPFDNESIYDNEYDGTKILSVITKSRSGGDPNVYANVSKVVYSYGSGTGIEQLQLGTKVYPTIFNGAVTVNVSEPSVVEILNVNGQLVLRVGKVADESSIQTSELLPGVYFIRIESVGKPAEVIKVIKK